MNITMEELMAETGMTADEAASTLATIAERSFVAIGEDQKTKQVFEYCTVQGRWNPEKKTANPRIYDRGLTRSMKKLQAFGTRVRDFRTQQAEAEGNGSF